MHMPSSVYWKLRLWNFGHDYIVGLNDYVASQLYLFPNGEISEADWHGLASVLNNNNSYPLEDVMEEFAAAYGI